MRIGLAIVFTVCCVTAQSFSGGSGSSFRRGLVSAWKLDESSGTRYDCIGTNHLAPVNTPGSAAGKSGNCATFVRASSQYASIADNASLSTGDIDWTISMWVKMTSKPAAQMSIVTKSAAAGNREYQINWNNTLDAFQFAIYTNASSANTVTWTGTPSLDTWYHVLVWHEGSGDRRGISVDNGTPVITQFTDNGTVDTTAPFAIGATGSIANFFDGAVDEVCFWKRLLSPSEKTQLYSEGRGAFARGFHSSVNRYAVFNPGTEAYSWWVHPSSIIFRGFPLIGYVNNAGVQSVVRTTGGGVPSLFSSLQTVSGKDDHNAPAIRELNDGSVLYAWAMHNIESKLYYHKSTNTTGLPGNLITPSQLTTLGLCSYAQIFTYGDNVYAFNRYSNIFWGHFKSANNASTWTTNRPFAGDNTGTTPQLYLQGRQISSSAVRFFITNHGTATNNNIWVADLDLSTELLTSGGVSLGYLDGTIASGKTLPAARADLTSLLSGTTTTLLRLLDVNGAGIAFTYCEFDESGDPSVYKLARLTGASAHNPAHWTFSEIVASGESFYPISHYVGGVVFANESHSGLRLYVSRESSGIWRIEQWDSAAGDGSDWVTTTLDSSAIKLLRPISPVGATSYLPVYWQRGTAYTDFSDYDLHLNLLQ